MNEGRLCLERHEGCQLTKKIWNSFNCSNWCRDHMGDLWAPLVPFIPISLQEVTVSLVGSTNASVKIPWQHEKGTASSLCQNLSHRTIWVSRARHVYTPSLWSTDSETFSLCTLIHVLPSQLFHPLQLLLILWIIYLLSLIISSLTLPLSHWN